MDEAEDEFGFAGAGHALDESEVLAGSGLQKGLRLVSVEL